MPLFDSVTSKIDVRLTKSNEYKKNKLQDLRDLIQALQEKTSVAEDELLSLRQACIDLLADEKFTYKQFTLFGTPSNCTKIANRIIQRIECQMGELLLLKLPEEKGVDKASLMRLLQARDYSQCVTVLKGKSDQASNKLRAWLQKKEKLPQLHLDDVVVTAADPIQGWVEWDASQAVYDLDGVKQVMQRMPESKRVGFIYVIDEQGRPFFSLGTTEVSHCNILGDRKSCCGAGEVYLTRRDKSLSVNVINNRSGLYRPDTSHHEPLKVCLSSAGLLTHATRLMDEAAKVQADLLDYRTMR